MNDRNNRVCPVEKAGSLDNILRRWLQHPKKILRPYIREGMTVLDLGCGPGFFSIYMAEMVGKSGRVIAADLQEGMIEKLRDKIRGTEFEVLIQLHKSEKNRIGVSEKVDFVLAFYMVHEVQNKEALFEQISSLLKPKGQLFIVEPPFHVSKAAFEETIEKAKIVGLTTVERPKVLFSKAVIMKRADDKR